MNEMEKRIESAMLLEFYGPLLSPRVREQLAMYLNEDLTLTEIAQQDGISRQAAYDAVRRGETQLNELEQQLGLYARWKELRRHVSLCRKYISQVQCEGESSIALENALHELDEMSALDDYDA